jgi:hypothetical protein
MLFKFPRDKDLLDKSIKQVQRKRILNLQIAQESAVYILKKIVSVFPL